MEQVKINGMLLKRIEVLETELKELREGAAGIVRNPSADEMTDFWKTFAGPENKVTLITPIPKEPVSTAWFRDLLYNQPIGNIISFGDYGTWTLAEKNGERYFIWAYKWLVTGSQVIGSMYNPKTAIQPEILRIFADKFGGHDFGWENVEAESMCLNTGVSAYNFEICKFSQKKRKPGAPTRKEILGF